MKISRKAYARLTLPWRVIDGFGANWPQFWKPTGESFQWVTACKVRQMIALYPLGWPSVIVFPFLMLALVVVTAVMYPFMEGGVRLAEWINRKWDSCARVTWTDSPPPSPDTPPESSPTPCADLSGNEGEVNEPD